MNNTPKIPPVLTHQEQDAPTHQEVANNPQESTSNGGEYKQSYDLELAIGKKLTHKQEQFAWLIATGKPDYVAYKEAYGRHADKDDTLRSNAYKTKQAEGVKEAIGFFKEQIRKQAVRAFEYDNEKAFEELNEVHQMARERKDLKNMLACIKQKTDIAGLIVRKTQDVTPPKSLDTIDQELKELLKTLPAETVRKALGKDVLDVQVKELPMVDESQPVYQEEQGDK